jgi:hypothetical protein
LDQNQQRHKHRYSVVKRLLDQLLVRPFLNKARD